MSLVAIGIEMQETSNEMLNHDHLQPLTLLRRVKEIHAALPSTCLSVQSVCRDSFTQLKLTGICFAAQWVNFPLLVSGVFFFAVVVGEKKLIRLRTVTRQSRGNGPNLVFKSSTNLSPSLSAPVFVAELGLKSINQIRLATDHIARGRPDPD